MNNTYPSPHLRGRQRPLSAQTPSAQPSAAQQSTKSSEEPWGLLSIRSTENEIIGSGFYSSEGRITLIFDIEPKKGRILIYNRTPEHPGSKKISPNLNIKDATNGDDHLSYIGKLRRLQNHDGWWGELERAPKGRDQRGRPRCFACVPPTSSNTASRQSKPALNSQRRHGKPLWGSAAKGTP